MGPSAKLDLVLVIVNDYRSLPGEPTLPFDRIMAGWYAARSDRRDISANEVVLTGLYP